MRDILDDLSQCMSETQDVINAKDKDIEDLFRAVGDFVLNDIDDVYSAMNDASDEIHELRDEVEELKERISELEEELSEVQP